MHEKPCHLKIKGNVDHISYIHNIFVIIKVNPELNRLCCYVNYVAKSSQVYKPGYKLKVILWLLKKLPSTQAGETERGSPSEK